MSLLTRAELLKTGAAGVVLLALADCSRPPLAGLNAQEGTIVRAIADAMLDGAIPAAAAARAAALTQSVDGFAVAVAGLPPGDERQVHQLLSVLSFPPTRRLVAGLPPWNEASRDDVAAFLMRWRLSGWQLLRSGYDALHQLVMAAWYARDEAWPRIGYPGPPRIVG